MDFMGWEGVYMGKIDKKIRAIRFRRMVPPGKMIFFYTFKSKETYNRRYLTTDSKHHMPIVYDYGDRLQHYQHDKVNITSASSANKLVTADQYYIKTNVLPRIKDLVYEPPKQKQKEQKVKWQLVRSIFKDYVKDSDELLRKCFEFDMKCSRISRIIKNEDDYLATKQILWQNYRDLKNTYKHYASLNPIGEIWCLNQYSYLLFVEKIDIIDEHIRQQEVDIKFIATNSNPDMKGPRNPDKGLVRYGLLECLVRLGDEKYIKTQICSNYKEMMEKMICYNCKGEIKQYDPQVWRNSRYWNEKCEKVIIKYKFIIDNVYYKFSVKKVAPGRPKFMCLDELLEICKICDLFIDDNLSETDVQLAFNLAMMTQVDELNSNRIFQMSLLEFYEAIARIADKVSLAQYDKLEMGFQERMDQPLHIKMESLLYLLYDCLFDNEFYKQNPLNKQSMFCSLASDDEDSEEKEKSENSDEVESVFNPYRSMSFLNESAKQVVKQRYQSMTLSIQSHKNLLRKIQEI